MQQNYGAFDNVVLENAAIGPIDGLMPFFHLADATEEERARLPSWYDGVGSFGKEVVLGHAKDIPDVEERLVVTDVRTLTFGGLCERNGVERIDLLLIDTEGFDWEIIRLIDLPKWSPTLLIYEHFHLSPQARLDCARHLNGIGYATMEEGFDTFCLGRQADIQLRDAWGRLRPAVSGVSVNDEQ